MSQLGYYKPDYRIYKFREGLYKIIKFKQSEGLYINTGKSKEEKQNESKLVNNLIRARTTVLQLALCNDWEWFATFTVDPQKYDRTDLSKYQKDLSQFFRNRRKKYDTDLAYLMIPERHANGAWHIHGLLKGIPDSQITNFVKGIHPVKLIRNGFKNWGEYSDKFGFVSLGQIRSTVATAFYIAKYITKDMARCVNEYGAHLYMASQGLKRAELKNEIYGQSVSLDSYLTNKNEYCSTGYAFDEDSEFPYRYDEQLQVGESSYDESYYMDADVHEVNWEDDLGLDLFDFVKYEQLYVSGWR